MKRILIYLTLVLLLASCSEVQETSAPTLTELHEVGKLELIEYRTEEIFIISPKEQKLKLIMTLDEVSNYLDNLLTVGDRIGVYSFENFSIAYIDLSQLRDEDIRYDASRHAIVLTLPAIQIEPIGRVVRSVSSTRESADYNPISPAKSADKCRTKPQR